MVAGFRCLPLLWETAAQLQAVLETPDIADVYLSSRLFFSRQGQSGDSTRKPLFSRCTANRCTGPESSAFYTMPEIFREEMVPQYAQLIPVLQEAGFDGILVHGMDELEWCREGGWPENSGRMRLPMS